jgi:hypothetical protein
MSYRRYEILLPTRYNDGSRVETEKVDLTLQEIVNQFGGVTFHPEHLLGVWLYEGARFEEYNVRLVVDVEDTAESANFFQNLKQILKTRFRQVEIWIVSYEIRIT